MKPRVFISLASSCLGGPGKGVLQFLKSGGLERCNPVLVDFITASGPNSEYARAMRAAGASVVELVQRRRFDLDLLGQAERVVRQEGCQILQSHGYKSHVICAWLKYRTGLPWVAFVHGWTAENLRMHGYRLLEMGIVGLATRVVAVSHALGQRLPLVARRKMTVIPNAVDPREVETVCGRDIRAEYGIAPHAKVAGVVGRLSPEKGQLHFVRALAKVRQRIPDAVGLLVGDGQDRAMLEAETRELGLQKAVLFAGHNECVGDFYRAMTVVVMPSLSEGMPNVALEAMMFGKPVVASRVGGVPEVVVEDETGFMVKAGDEGALALALIRMLTSPSRMQAMGEAGRHRVLENFSPTVRVERLLSLYKELLLARILEGEKNA